MVTFDPKQALVILIYIALLVLIIFLIIMVSNVIKTLKKANGVIDDAQRVSTIAAERTEQVDKSVDDAVDKVMKFTKGFRTGTGVLSKLSDVSSAVKARRSAKTVDAEVSEADDYVTRSKARRARRSR